MILDGTSWDRIVTYAMAKPHVTIWPLEACPLDCASISAYFNLRCVAPLRLCLIKCLPSALTLTGRPRYRQPSSSAAFLRRWHCSGWRGLRAAFRRQLQ